MNYKYTLCILVGVKERGALTLSHNSLELVNN